MTNKSGLGTMDASSLQAAAEVYRKLGMVSRPLRVADVVAADLLPGR